MTEARIGVLTISDRASRGEYEDRSGKAISAYLAGLLTNPYETDYRVIPDEQPLIIATGASAMYLGLPSQTSFGLSAR